MTRDEQTRWSLRLAETGGAMFGAAMAVLVTVVGTLAGLPVMRAGIYGILVVVAWGLTVLFIYRRAVVRAAQRDDMEHDTGARP